MIDPFQTYRLARLRQEPKTIRPIRLATRPAIRPLMGPERARETTETRPRPRTVAL